MNLVGALISLVSSVPCISADTRAGEVEVETARDLAFSESQKVGCIATGLNVRCER